MHEVDTMERSTWHQLVDMIKINSVRSLTHTASAHIVQIFCRTQSNLYQSCIYTATISSDMTHKLM